MIIENIKSVLLFLLFGLSLLLTYQLWYGDMPAQLLQEDVYENLMVEEPRSLENLLMPYFIAVNVEDGFYIFKKGETDYESLWDELSNTLQRISSDTIVEEAMPPEGSRKLLTCYLQPDLPVGKGLPWLEEASYAEIRTIELYSNNDRKWLILAESGNKNTINLLLSPGIAEHFSALLDEVSTEDKKLHARLTADHLPQPSEVDLEVEVPIYVPVEPLFMDELALKPEAIEHDLILKTFFVDFNMARIIEEKDGGLIYTDGEKGLRLTETGLEYSAPQKEVGQVTVTYPEALFNSSSLISYHGGWPENLRLDGFSLSGWGRVAYYNASWCMFHDGFPIFTNQPTTALFNDNGLFYYARFIFFTDNAIMEEGKQKPVTMWYDALAEALDLIKEQNSKRNNPLLLEEISLGYVVPNSPNNYRGVPVWRITISGETFTLTADQLDLLEEEDLI